MADKTGIEWTDATWSPVRVRVREDAAAIAEAKGYASLVQIAGKMAGRVGPHCEHVSPGCAHCYAETNNHRCLPANGTGLPYDRRSRDLVEAFVDEAILLQPLRWKRGRKIFVENQSDIFGEWVTDAMLDRVFAVMALCTQHTFQVLTKRPERMLAYISKQSHNDSDIWIAADGLCVEQGFDEYIPDWPLPNVWLGVSAEDQDAADRRLMYVHRLAADGWQTMVSFEPLLSGITPHPAWFTLGARTWAIVGGESGLGAQPMHPDWARSLRDQCAAAGVPFFFKQWGDWWPGSDAKATPISLYSDGRTCAFTREAILAEERRSGRRHGDFSPTVASRIGKKAAGHLLDGVEWHQFPER